jgi:hypothetical protein
MSSWSSPGLHCSSIQENTQPDSSAKLFIDTFTTNKIITAYDLIAWYVCQYKNKAQKERKDNLRVWRSTGRTSIFGRLEVPSLILRHIPY